MVTINLNDFKTKGAKVFTGRDRGEKVRIASEIDSLMSKDDKLEVIVPRDIYSINPSFLEEFLVNLVSEFGKKVFFDRVVFKNLGDYSVDKDLDEAVDRILRDENALS